LAVVLYKRTRAADAPTVPSVSNGNSSPGCPLKQRLQILQSPDPPASSLQPSLPITLPGPLSPLRAADEPREAREGRDELEQAVAGAVHIRSTQSQVTARLQNFPRVTILQGRDPWSSGEATTFSAPKG
jgi:hypothetical protein